MNAAAIVGTAVAAAALGVGLYAIASRARASPPVIIAAPQPAKPTIAEQLAPLLTSVVQAQQGGAIRFEKDLPRGSSPQLVHRCWWVGPPRPGITRSRACGLVSPHDRRPWK
jgi:hypothetical protein